MKKLTKIPRVTGADVLGPHCLRLSLDDGVVRDVDLSSELWGAMFEPLRGPEYFARVVVDHGTVTWPNGLDLDPVVLHGDCDAAPAPTRRSN